MARLAYGKDYYAGFVYDPDGHNVRRLLAASVEGQILATEL